MIGRWLNQPITNLGDTKLAMKQEIANAFDSLTAADIEHAVRAFDAGVDHDFYDSTKFDVLVDGKTYLVKHLRHNISPMLAMAPSSSVVGSGIKKIPCEPSVNPPRKAI